MTRLVQLESESLLKHGTLMIGLGTSVCALGSVMAKPIHQEMGYMMAATAISAYLIVALISVGLRERRAFSRRIIAAYIAVGTAMVCYTILLGIQSNSLGMPVVSLVTGLLGLFWGFWYLSIAFWFHPNSPQAIGLCALAAANSSFGVILGTISELSKLSTITVCGCYTILLGVQMYLTAVGFHRKHMREKVVDRHF